MNSTLWQHPYVNVFKQYSVSTWKKVTKGGDVISKMDRNIKATVVELRGTVPASNFIQLPGLSSQSLRLSGRFFYVIFRPASARHFVIHIDVATCEGASMRLSFSNLYRQAKISSTTLQFPFGVGEELGAAEAACRWTLLSIDLAQLLTRLANRRFSHVRGVQLCANMRVRTILTSDQQFWPLGIAPRPPGFVALPREVAFPALPGGQKWSDQFRMVRYPDEDPLLPFGAPPSGELTPDLPAQPVEASKLAPPFDSLSTGPLRLPSHSLPTADDLPLVSAAAEAEPVIDVASCAVLAPLESQLDEVHILARPSQPSPPTEEAPRNSAKEPARDEPLLELEMALGVTREWRHLCVANRNGSTEVVYACHAIVVALDTVTRRQRHFVGHPSPVTALALDGATQWLASSCDSLLRLWDFASGRFLALAKAPVRSVSLLALAASPDVVLAAGRDDQGRHAVSAWRIETAKGATRLVLMARAHVEADVRQLRVLPPLSVDTSGSGHRLVSVGRNNVRLWRLKAGLLRSSPVDLGEYAGAQVEFVDCAFDPTWRHPESAEEAPEASDRPLTVFAAAASGHLFCIDAAKFRLAAVRQLLPTSQPSGAVGVALTGVAVAPDEAFVATASRDGFLRLWPADFARGVLLEAEHDSPLSALAIADEGRSVLAMTSAGSLGQLSLATRAYVTLTRAHPGEVTSAALEPSRRLLATASATPGSERCVRVWRLEDDGEGATLLCTYVPPGGAACTALAFVPGGVARLLCGCDGGSVRLLEVTAMSAPGPPAQRIHRGAIVAILFSPGGHRLFTADSQGSLLLLDAASGPPFRVRRQLEAALARVEFASPGMLALDGSAERLAYIGPSASTVTLAEAHSLAPILRVDVALIERQALEVAPKSATGAARLAFSPNERHLLVSTASGLLLRLATSDGALLASRRFAAASGLAVSPGGGRFLLGCGASGIVSVCEASLQPGKRSQRFLGHQKGAAQLLFTPDCATLVTAGDAILLWRFRGDPQPPLPALAFSEEEEETEEVREPTVSGPEAPLAMAHFVKRFEEEEEESEMAERRYLAPPAHCAIDLAAAIGYRGAGPQSLVWHGASGLLAYACGRAVIVEDLAAGEANGTRQRHLLPPEARAVSALALSEDCRLLAVAGVGRPAQLCVWDVRRLAEVGDSEAALLQLRHCRHAGPAIQALAFSPTGRHLLSMGTYKDASLLLWDTGAWEVVARVALPAPQHALAWVPLAKGEDDAFVTAGSAGGIHWWRLDPSDASPSLQMSLDSPPEMMADGGASFELTCLVFLAPGLLLVGANNGRVALWRGGHCVLHWMADPGELAFLQPIPGSKLLSGGAGGSLRFWDLSGLPLESEEDPGVAPTVVMTREVALGAPLVAISAGDPAGELCVLGAADGAIWMVDWREEAPTQLVPPLGRVLSLAWAPGECGWLACALDSGAALVLDALASREPICRIEVGAAKALCVAFSPPASSVTPAGLSVGFADGSVRLFDLQAVQLRRKWSPHSAPVTALQFAPSHAGALISGCADGTLALLSLQRGVERVLRDHRGAPITALDARGERWLAASSDGRVSVWRADWTSGACELLDWLSFGPKGPGATLAAFVGPHSPQEVIFCAPGPEPKLQSYCLSSRRVLRSFDLCERPQAIAVSPTEALAAFGSPTWLLKMVDLGSGSFQDFVQHGAGVKALAFSQDGRHLASAARGEILLWAVRETSAQSEL